MREIECVCKAGMYFCCIQSVFRPRECVVGGVLMLRVLEVGLLTMNPHDGSIFVSVHTAVPPAPPLPLSPRPPLHSPTPLMLFRYFYFLHLIIFFASEAMSDLLIRLVVSCVSLCMVNAEIGFCHCSSLSWMDRYLKGALC